MSKVIRNLRKARKQAREIKQGVGEVRQELTRTAQLIDEAVKSLGSDGQEEVTCQQVFDIVEPFVNREATGRLEEIRQDYKKCCELHSEAEKKMAALKREMEAIEGKMNSLAGGSITQEDFTKHYEVVRDLQATLGYETAILQRRAASGVVFLTEIKAAGERLH